MVLRLPGVIGSNWQGNMPWINNAILKVCKNQDLHFYNARAYFNNVIDTASIYKFIKFYMDLKYKENFLTLNFSASKPIKMHDLLKYIKLKLNSNSKLIELTTENLSFKIDISLMKQKLNYKTKTTIQIIDEYLQSI